MNNQFPINPKWRQDFMIATIGIQNLFLELQEKWGGPTPQAGPQQPPAEPPAPQEPAPVEPAQPDY